MLATDGDKIGPLKWWDIEDTVRGVPPTVDLLFRNPTVCAPMTQTDLLPWTNIRYLTKVKRVLSRAKHFTLIQHANALGASLKLRRARRAHIKPRGDEDHHPERHRDTGAIDQTMG
jgi:hypothetical protein